MEKLFSSRENIVPLDSGLLYDCKVIRLLSYSFLKLIRVLHLLKVRSSSMKLTSMCRFLQGLDRMILSAQNGLRVDLGTVIIKAD